MLIQSNDTLQSDVSTFPIANEKFVCEKGPTLRRSPGPSASSSSSLSAKGVVVDGDSSSSPPSNNGNRFRNYPPSLPPKRLKRSCIQWVRMHIDHFLCSLLSLSILSVICTIAFAQSAQRAYSEEGRAMNSDERDYPDEKIVPDECYYIKRWGYEARVYDIVTDDGYILRMYRIIGGGGGSNDNSKKRPVLLGHGLFQCSGDFLLNEEKSLAFALVEQGYDVWLGNTRATGSVDHVSLSHRDPEYWAWGLKELGTYDWPTMIDFIREETGHHKIAYIGHSQGNAMAFVGLKLRHEVADKLSCFVALAPAVFSGTLVNKFPLKQLIAMNKRTFTVIFGSGAFIPIMSFAQRICHPVLFSHMAYSMFAYLFSWWDTHWLRRRKPKYFQFTPRPVSSQLISDWMEGWGKRGVCLHVTDASPIPFSTSSTVSKVPLTVFYGTDDFLIDGERLVQTFEGYENYGRVSPRDIPLRKTPESTKSGSGKSSLFPMLDLVHAQCIDGYEHMDNIWAHNNVITTYPAIFTALSTARWTANST
ncbi:Alpha/Beta hydrolase protein [Zychaea mexicana]|uniref:Alpha/Beta hydrolase protein n=1 Tax=Zychaea mexicana TaxID=64656 RepID=UPI0022FF1A33|nr:Alpha/Beta hydrolase protein [Zychaea mexicana]KAI9497470.1 Alpha/Beta hydrolase protein [Zychaea mexicana]